MKTRHMAACAALFGAALGIALFSAQPALADNPLVGTWKLVSWVVTDIETKESKATMGAHPTGLMMLTPEGRFLHLLTAEGRKSGQTEAERARNSVTMIANGGKYRIEDGKLSEMIEVSSNPAAVGTVHKLEFKVEGNRLTATTEPYPGPLMGNRMVTATSVWERVTD